MSKLIARLCFIHYIHIYINKKKERKEKKTEDSYLIQHTTADGWLNVVVANVDNDEWIGKRENTYTHGQKERERNGIRKSL